MKDVNSVKTKSTSALISIILIAVCLRAPITGVGPLITTLQADLNLSPTIAGLLTTFPLLAFALVSFFTDWLGKKLGAGKLILLGVIAIGVGLLIRSFLGTAGLFIGTVIIGLGIGIGNVLLPAVVKAKFPEKMGSITGAYTTFMAGFASLSTGITVPLVAAFGGNWRLALLIWIVLVIVALIVWLPNVSLKLDNKLTKIEGAKKRHVATSSVTWFITIFMGLASMMFYVTVAWFSTILQSQGYSQVTSGLYNMIMMLIGLPGAFVMPIIAVKTKHQGLWGAFIGLLFLLGNITLMFAQNPVALVICMLTLGFSTGGAIAYIMVLFPLHTHDAEDAASLSAFAQGIGYIIAALGPVLVGKLFAACGNWNVPLWCLAGLSVVCMIFGLLSGRPKLVETYVRE